MIREAAWGQDYWSVIDMAQKFIAESHQQDLTWDDANAQEFIWGHFNDEDTLVSLAEVEHPNPMRSYRYAVGYAVCRVQTELTVEKIAYISSFYVRPDFRGEIHGWQLLKSCKEYAIRRGAAFIYAASTAGMADDGETLKAFRRLFEASGMSYLGDFFVQDLRHG